MPFRALESDPFPRFSFPRYDELAPSTAPSVRLSSAHLAKYSTLSTPREELPSVTPSEWVVSAVGTPVPAVSPAESCAAASKISPSPDPAVIRLWKQRLITEKNTAAHEALIVDSRKQTRTAGEFTHVPSAQNPVPSYAQPTSSSRLRRSSTPTNTHRTTQRQVNARADDTMRWAVQQKYTGPMFAGGASSPRSGVARLQRFIPTESPSPAAPVGHQSNAWESQHSDENQTLSAASSGTNTPRIDEKRRGGVDGHSYPGGDERPFIRKSVSPEDVLGAFLDLKREELGAMNEVVVDFTDSPPQVGSTHHHHHLPFRADRLVVSHSSTAAPAPLPQGHFSGVLDHASGTSGGGTQLQCDIERWQQHRTPPAAAFRVCCPCCFHVFPAGEHVMHTVSP